MTEQLESLPLEERADESVFEYTLPPLVLGMIGREVSCNSTLSGIPMRGWGADEQTRVVRWGGREFLLSAHRHRGVPGLMVQITDADGKRRSLWHSWDSLREVTVLISGGVEL